jgi:hypothetical protein
MKEWEKPAAIAGFLHKNFYRYFLMKDGDV